MTVQQSTLVITVNARNAQRDIERLDRSLLDLGTQGDRTSRSMGSSLSSLTAYMAGLLSVATAISKVDAYTSMQNRLKLATATQKELNQATNDTFAIAQRTAQAWDGVVQVYQRFADNAKVLGINLKQVASLTDTVSKSIAISGASAASAEAALVQFGQALASGVLRGEEFNSIAEQAPGLLKAIAFGLDTNVGSLRAMAAEGQITGDVLVKSLSKAQPYIDALVQIESMKPLSPVVWPNEAFQYFYPRGTRVEKVSGPEWNGIVVGHYSSSFTPDGVVIECLAPGAKGQVHGEPAKRVRKI